MSFEKSGKVNGLCRIFPHCVFAIDNNGCLATLLCLVPRVTRTKDRLEHLEQLIAK
jgi:hypothetical protein